MRADARKSAHVLTTSAIRSSLAGTGMSSEAQDRILHLHGENSDLSAEVKSLGDKLAKAKDVSRKKLSEHEMLMQSSLRNKTLSSVLSTGMR